MILDLVKESQRIFGVWICNVSIIAETFVGSLRKTAIFL
jgi:hypothetical protein